MGESNIINILITLGVLTVSLEQGGRVALAEDSVVQISVDKIVEHIEESKGPNSQVDEAADDLGNPHIGEDELLPSLALGPHLQNEGVPVRSCYSTSFRGLRGGPTGTSSARPAGSF